MASGSPKWQDGAVPRPIKKLLVANRGEIAIRVFRAAYELGIETVAVFTWEDRQSLHRLKADESYQIGTAGHPLRPYLDPQEIVRVAVEAGVDAVHPGYGFMSESPEFADACEAAGLMFVGPPGRILRMCGNKMRARELALAAGVPVLAQSVEISAETALVEAEAIGYPIFVKAASGGGGRGLRRVDSPEELVAAVETARREAESAFGDPTVFLEQAVIEPRHIEVQLLGDGNDVVHLFERDCSVQRRHQKVVEIAPAPNLEPEIRDQMCREAIKFGKHLGYVNAGTVEFLLQRDGSFVFIEMNPRIQVEHTVTEETTGVDLVHAQIRIAGGESLENLGLTQEVIVQSGAALQCRITTEDPANGFRPDTGRILAFRQPGGAGIRLDGGGGYSGAEITPYFDSLLTKLTCRGRDFPEAVARSRRALAEFRVRGPATNIGFIQAVLESPEFRAGGVSTSFIERHPELLNAKPSLDRATKLLQWLGEVTVNRPHGDGGGKEDPTLKLPPRPTIAPPEGTKTRLDREGPAAFATWMRRSVPLLVTDTTLRDAHQSILATRVRTFDLVAGARHLAQQNPGLLSLECWGGATYDVALRFLHEDPWERLERLRDAAPNICLQMLLRGRNTVGYSAYPPLVSERFVQEAQRCGIDIFRVFDALNSVEQMRPAIETALTTGALVEGTICYTGNIEDPAENLYTLDYYLGVAQELIDAGVHVLCVKDMAGLLRPGAAHRLIGALRENFTEAPVHLHTHDTAGGQLATYLAATMAGVDAIDAAAAPLSGMTSQPSIAAVIASFADTEAEPDLTLEGFAMLEPFWEATRHTYAPFEAGLSSPTGTVYQHEIPGGQLSNLRQQAIAVGLGDRFEEVEQLYADCDRLLGRIIKVTPTSKVVGDLALQLAAGGLTTADLKRDPAAADLPDSVVGFLHGELGEPVAGFPEPFRTEALVGRRPAEPPLSLTPQDVDELNGPGVRAALSRLLFPKPFASFQNHIEDYGQLSRLPTNLFLYGLKVGQQDVSISLGRGLQLLVGLDAIGEPDERGMRRVVFRLNGQMRPLDIRDHGVGQDEVGSEQADQENPGHVGAPFTGIVTVQVEPGDVVRANQPVALIEAMKMESVISAPISGVVERVAGPAVRSVDPGDLIVVIRPN